ncbi:MAG: hypothetical protein ACRDP3_16330 [Streptomyces sp.]|uniref:hypothetical protein n=1 Tax=Streptomyces sp. TaxID=1931 RepID=UPI003D6B2FE0
MWWWITARRAHIVISAALAAYVLLLVVLQDTTTELPSPLTSSGAPVLLVLMAPVPLCAGMMSSLQSRLLAAEETGVRPLKAMDTALVLAVITAALAVGAAVDELLDTTGALAAGRNTAFLIGLMLCIAPLAGARAVLLPAAWVITVALAGFTPTGHAYPWTVVGRDLADPYAAVAAPLVLAAGLAVQLRARPTP